MALGGWGPVQYGHLVDQAIAVARKIVIVGFYLGNDLSDVYTMAYESDIWKDLRDPRFVPTDQSTSTIDYLQALWTGQEPGSLQYELVAWQGWLAARSLLYANPMSHAAMAREDRSVRVPGRATRSGVGLRKKASRYCP